MRKVYRLTVLILAVIISVFIVNLNLIQAENVSQTAFTISNSTPADNESVTFEAMPDSVQADDTTTSYHWDFGDGVTASGKQVTHVFATVDDFKVCLTVTDDNNDTDTISKWVFVGRPQGWTKKTHQSEDGYYEVVFPEDKVLRMDITISPENYQAMEDDLSNPAELEENDLVYVPVTIEFNNSIWRNVGMRYTVNETLALLKQTAKQKYPFELNFDIFKANYPEIKGQNFFGFKQLLCDNNWADASFVLDVACSDIFRAGGVPTPRGSFYRMFLNTGDGPVYLGLYSVFEEPEDQMLKTQFSNTAGNMYKLDGKAAGWATWKQDAFEKKTNQEAADWSDLKAVIAALNADRTDAAVWRAGLEAVFDVKTFLRWLAINTALVNTDLNIASQNYYLYQNLADQGRLVWIPRGFNLSLNTILNSGTDEGDTGAVPNENPDNTEITAAEATQADKSDNDGAGDREAASPALREADHNNRPLIRLLMADPVYNEIYKSELRKALSGCFNEATLTAKIRRLHEMVRNYAVGPEGESATYSYLTNGETEFDKALTDILAHISNRCTAVKELLGLSIPVAVVSVTAPPRQISEPQDCKQAVAKPSLSKSKQKNDINLINQSIATVKNNNNMITEMSRVMGIKIVPTVFTVFFMVMVVFGALACCTGNGRKRFKTKKKIETDKCYRAPMGQWGQTKNMSEKGKGQWPVPEVASLANKPTSVLGRNFER